MRDFYRDIKRISLCSKHGELKEFYKLLSDFKNLKSYHY